MPENHIAHLIPSPELKVVLIEQVIILKAYQGCKNRSTFLTPKITHNPIIIFELQKK